MDELDLEVQLTHRQLRSLEFALRHLIDSGRFEGEYRTVLNNSEAELRWTVRRLEEARERADGSVAEGAPDKRYWARNAIARGLDAWSRAPQWSAANSTPGTVRSLVLTYSEKPDQPQRLAFNMRFPELGDAIPIVELDESDAHRCRLVLGFSLRELNPEIRPVREDWHVTIDVADLPLGGHAERLTQILDLESEISPEDRATELSALLTDELMPIMVTGRWVAGIRQLLAAGVLSGAVAAGPAKGLLASAPGRGE